MGKNGWHKIESFKTYSKEWVDANMAAVQFKNKVLTDLKKIVDDLPDYDTGYMEIEAGNETYEILHNLNCIPKRVIAYFCRVKEPMENNDKIYLYPFTISGDYGSRLYFENRNKAVLYTHDTYVYGTWDEGYVRVLLWK